MLEHLSLILKMKEIFSLIFLLMEFTCKKHLTNT